MPAMFDSDNETWDEESTPAQQWDQAELSTRSMNCFNPLVNTDQVKPTEKNLSRL